MHKSLFICRNNCGYSDSMKTSTANTDRMKSSVTDI